MTSNISSHFIAADNVCNYIPVVSTISNFIDIIQKLALKIFKLFGGQIENPYYKHLDEKPFVYCAIGLVPGFGNVALVINDFAMSSIFGLAVVGGIVNLYLK